MAVRLFYQGTSINLKDRNKLKSFVSSIFILERKELISLQIVFCTDEYLLSINRRFLKHDYYTDIITFNLSEGTGGIEGEIYISTNRVKENAKEMHISLREEIHRVIFHGVLHLCGYKDKTRKDSINMRAAEEKYLGLYFYNVPRITVSRRNIKEYG